MAQSQNPELALLRLRNPTELARRITAALQAADQLPGDRYETAARELRIGRRTLMRWRVQLGLALSDAAKET